MTDHSKTIAKIAGDIAVRLSDVEMVKFGPSTMDFYSMADVEEFISCDSDLCEKRRELLVQHMKSTLLGDVAEVPLSVINSDLEDLYIEGAGAFAESPGVASRVHSFEVDNAADYE